MAATGKVITGYSKPYVAKYGASGGTVTYTGGMRLARGVSVTISPEVGDANPFYADNVESETVPGVFTGGTADLVVDGLLNEAEAFIYGLPDPEQLSYGESQTVDVYAYGENVQIPYVGVGFIIRYMSDGVTTYCPMVLTKARFQTANTEASTQEESIDWQTQTLTVDLMRDDSTAKNWKKFAVDQDTEAAAEEILKAMLNITEGP